MSRASYEDLEVRRQRASDEAAAWLVRLQEEALTFEERSSLTDWLRESPLHVAAMLRVSHADSVLMAFDGWNDIPVSDISFNDTVIEWSAPVEPQPAVMRSPTLKRRAALGAVAASIIISLGVALWWSGVIGGSVYLTAMGERRDVVLHDGSTLRLGPETRARVQFSARQRYIALEHGEAVFRVSKDPTRPFIVAADRARVRAIGTEFGVEKRDDTVIVTVEEGRVAVTQGAMSTLPFSERPSSGSPVALEAGDQIAVPHTGTTASIRKVDSANSLAWVNGRLVFDNDPISLVIERFNQYNPTRLAVTDPRIAARRISGSFDATDPESFLAFLRSAVPVRIARASNGDIAIGAPDIQATPGPR